MFEKTALDGVWIVTPRRFSDNRGFFSETYNETLFREMGLNLTFVQDNHSLSNDIGVVRGLHFQAPPHAQDKLVRVGVGRVLDVAVDVRKGSPTYGKWVAVELSAENGKQLLIPKGFLHGFLTLEPFTELLYKCSDIYAPDCDGAVRFNDKAIGIDWPIDLDKVILSTKDANAMSFEEFESPFFFEDKK